MCIRDRFNPANAECDAIDECSKDVYNHLVYCKISDDIVADCESKLLLTWAGRWFSFRRYKSSKTIFLFGHFFLNLTGIHISGIFETEQSHLKITVCLRHRDLFGIRWRCNKPRCSINTSAAIDAHRGKSSTPKAQDDLKRAHSAYVMSATNMIAQVGSRKYLTLLLLSGSICINGFRSW